MLERKLATVNHMVASQRNRIAKLEADRKALGTELKAKLRSAQLAAKDNSVVLLARVNGGKNELNKAKRDLLKTSKSLSKALKEWVGTSQAGAGPATSKHTFLRQSC
jgi:CII-binding regulator of phage lambda lysogenization HflD